VRGDFDGTVNVFEGEIGDVLRRGDGCGRYCGFSGYVVRIHSRVLAPVYYRI
jgi:hypothetical protein